MQGDFAAVTPVYAYTMGAEDGGGGGGVPIESAFSAWRTLLRWLFVDPTTEPPM